MQSLKCMLVTLGLYQALCSCTATYYNKQITVVRILVTASVNSSFKNFILFIRKNKKYFPNE